MTKKQRHRFVQGEPFKLRHLGDGERGHSLVLPLPKGRALRIGFAWRAWCRLGPRRYTVIATPQFVEQYERLTGGSADDLRDRGIHVQGDLRPVEES